MQRFQGGRECKVHRLLYHSALGLRVIKKKDAGAGATCFGNPKRPAECQNLGDAEVRVSTLDVHAFGTS